MVEMPRTPVSNRKKFEVVRLWLIERLTYEEIKGRTGLGLGTISKIINEFKKVAKTLSLEGAARLYGVKDDLEALLALSDDLRRTGVNIGEAKKGLLLIEKLRELGVSVDDVEVWIGLCRKIAPPSYPIRSFVPASIKLSKLEDETGLSYEKMLAKKTSRLKDDLAKLEKDLECKSSMLTAKCRAI